MIRKSKLEAVNKGIELYGADFYMCDPRNLAAPFHIANLKDKDTFVQFASPFIWELYTLLP